MLENIMIMLLIFAGVFFTLRLRFINVRWFWHSTQVICGKYSKNDDPGAISHFSTLCVALSKTVGIANISSISMAVVLAGPGVVFWIFVMGFFSMSVKCAEVFLAHKSRSIEKNGRVIGGPFMYVRDVLSDCGLSKLGLIAGTAWGLLFFCIELVGGTLFQANQMVEIIANGFAFDKFIISIALAVLVGVVVIFGVRGIARVSEILVPFMSAIYVACCIIIISYHSDKIGNAFSLIIDGAFNPKSACGGMLCVIFIGCQRALFSNVAGTGISSVTHSLAKTDEPMREGGVALLEPFLDTCVICCMTGFIVVVTGVYNIDASTANGILIANNAFASVSPWFANLLVISAVCFGFSTIVSCCYSTETVLAYFLGEKLVMPYRIFFAIIVYLGNVISFHALLNYIDHILLIMVVINVITLLIVSGKISIAVKEYDKKIRS